MCISATRFPTIFIGSVEVNPVYQHGLFLDSAEMNTAYANTLVGKMRLIFNRTSGTSGGLAASVSYCVRYHFLIGLV